MGAGIGLFEWILLFGLSVLWGGSFFLNEIILRQLQPFTLVFLRVFTGAVFLWIYNLIKGEKPADKGSFVITAMILGLFNNFIPFSLIVSGQQYIEGGEASVINAAAPLFSAVIGHFIKGGEKLTPLRAIGLLTGWAGVVILVSSGTGSGSEAAGRLAVLGASLSYALGALYGKRSSSSSTTVLAAGMLTASSVFLLPMVVFIDKPWGLVLFPETVAAVAALGLLGTAIAYLIYFRLLNRIGATNLLLVTYLIPLTALLLGVAFLNESPGWRTVVGFAVIVAGLLVVDGRLTRPFKRRVGENN